MANENPQLKIPSLPNWLTPMLDLSWVETLTNAWKLGKKIIRGYTNEGVYEVLDYESMLELHDPKGIKATFSKRKRVRYLQDNIIAFQDYGWGDGEILRNYRTSRGKAVDCYRSGFKTYILLSLREVKNRNDIDEFNIRWNIRRGFLTKDGYWGTDVSQSTKHIKINVIFPKSRPPSRLSLEESNRKRTIELDRNAQQQLPDGRWLVTWATDRPRLYELYVLRWIW
jgi:hypothetical protein